MRAVGCNINQPYWYNAKADWDKVYDVVKLLIDKGAHVQAKANNGDTALSMAIRSKNTKLVTLLREKGAR